MFIIFIFYLAHKINHYCCQTKTRRIFSGGFLACKSVLILPLILPSVDDDCHDHDDNSDVFDARKFHGDTAKPDIDVDDYDYDEEFNGMRFQGVNKDYERVCDHCHCTAKQANAKRLHRTSVI